MLWILSIFCGVLLCLYSLLLVVYRVNWKKIPIYSAQQLNATTFISVIIPARNEADCIEVLLQSLLNQTYSSDCFEVLVIDDFSTDATAAIVKRYDSTNIRLISLGDYINESDINSFKKKAIEIGIQESKGTLIVTTDADCIAHKDWLRTIACYFEEHKPQMIVMPVIINPALSFIERFQSLDFMCMQGITGAAVYKKLHGMCNGANLAYTKQIFNAVGGFNGVDTIASGDDMLLLQKIAQQPNTEIAYLKSPEVIVETAPVKSISAFFHQRIRWASKADKYQDKSLLPVLLLVYFLNLGLLALFVALLFEGTVFYWRWMLFFVFSKTIIELIFLYPVATFFNQKKKLGMFPLLQPFHIAYTVIAGFLGKYGTYQWKSRTVK